MWNAECHLYMICNEPANSRFSKSIVVMQNFIPNLQSVIPSNVEQVGGPARELSKGARNIQRTVAFCRSLFDV